MRGQVLLDRGELRGDDPVPGEDERLHDAGDAAVAVTEWMDRDDVEVRHSRADNDVRVEVALVQPVDDLVHERGDFHGVRPAVHDPAVAAGDADLHVAPPARALVALEATCVEVQVEDDAVEPAERRVVSHYADVVHRPRVARDGHPVLVAGVCRLRSAHDCERLVVGDVEALDRRRALDRDRLRETPNRSDPCRRWLRDPAAESAVQIVE
jgi:hypothetical protein